MSGIIRSVQRDGIEQAEELEREAVTLDEAARQKRHTAAVLRTMAAVAATWNSNVRLDTGLSLSKPLRGEPIPTHRNSRPAEDRPPLVLNSGGRAAAQLIASGLAAQE